MKSTGTATVEEEAPPGPKVDARRGADLRGRFAEEESTLAEISGGLDSRRRLRLRWVSTVGASSSSPGVGAAGRALALPRLLAGLGGGLGFAGMVRAAVVVVTVAVGWAEDLPRRSCVGADLPGRP